MTAVGRSTYARLTVLAVAATALAVAGGSYVRMESLLGVGQYSVTLQLRDSGGIFTNAEVTSRGIPVGRVGTLTLVDAGVDVELLIDDSSDPISAATSAAVAARSAIGEQYVDLRPDTDEGPHLQDGSIIDRSRTTIPTPVENVLSNVDGLARSIPVDELRTVVTELGDGFDGMGGDLATLVESLDSLSAAQLDALPETLDLVRDGRVVLDTQSEQSSAIIDFSAGLDDITAQLRANDGDLRRIVDSGIDASDETGALITSAGARVTSIANDVASVAAAVSPRAWALRPLLQILPRTAMGARAQSPGDGTTHFGLVVETNNPPPCTVGYEATQRTLERERAADPDFDETTRDFPIDLSVGCTAPRGSVTGVRGAGSAPYMDPAIPQPWDDKPKVDPGALDLNPIANQLATLLGVTVR
ncbi:MCE family protein [Rhodococcus sp. BP-349]|uniref:MCE family protein n=1 Tax=unclassified Rhodococcus (in: high G+C Gram-positive bacteria) TaxID=192944 RepID=UPI001C9AF475|nr:MULTISPECIES: MCE family protein [unclassified Rhodococcus (in: high G+C Gram-positive bacteria)]MBY6537896.1 MCE family protein [Rhodococcus sp. BP-363]MBY6542233.1 MCE family protein [Rhodococcus sp. BP-369]MBY6561463.1 MCE family protein [Rhodococcus sp. BP-370]MBY6575755.1 MCE family protein [Rhodococcus sp. BP-364]MBY6585056.1 MCE family protein [Rhodococcus sp. BP-358]